MSNKPDDEQAFLKWLEGEGSVEDINNPDWKNRVDAVNQLKHQAEIEAVQPVPQWDRSAAFQANEFSSAKTKRQESTKTPWWQWQPMPALSMAFSIVALTFVLLKVELVIEPEGIMLTFAGDMKVNNEAEVARLVDLKLREFAAEQQVMLANYALDASEKQQASNLHLATYIIGATRQERNQDLNEFIGFINEQREDENLTQKIKFQQLERKIDRKKLKFSSDESQLTSG